MARVSEIVTLQCCTVDSGFSAIFRCSLVSQSVASKLDNFGAFRSWRKVFSRLNTRDRDIVMSLPVLRVD